MQDANDLLLLSLANLIILVILLFRTDAQLKKIISIEAFLARILGKAPKSSNAADDIPPPVLKQVKARKINKAAVEYRKFYDVSFNEALVAVRRLHYTIQRRTTTGEASSKASPPPRPS